MRGEQLVLHHDEVVDRVLAALAQRVQPGLERVGDQRRDVGMIHLDADRGGDLAGDQHLRERLARARSARRSRAGDTPRRARRRRAPR